ncbi:hypothetical protein Rs2_14807 [Raphanus sativus]|nr:hypothetical protein Rs2_14807 [Raphanus sativus]
MEREECSSSESGWTTYISSPMEEDEEEVTDEVYYEGHIIEKDRRKYANEYESNKDSDDSMASDASSGPSYHQTSNRGRRREGLVLRNGKSENLASSPVLKADYPLLKPTAGLATSPMDAGHRHRRTNRRFTRTRNGSEKIAYQLGLKEEEDSKEKRRMKREEVASGTTTEAGRS